MLGTPAVGTQVGTVIALRRYPVKSMAADSLQTAELSWHGVAGDRRWAFVRAESHRNGFPWHTIRENPLMCRYTTRFVDPERPDRSAIEVRSPAGGVFSLDDAALAAELGTGLRLMRLDRGSFDALPVSVITTGTVSALCELAGVPSNELRFRPNLVIEPLADVPYVEDTWVGSVLQIGGAAVRLDRRDSRCVVVNVDPETGQPNSDLLKVIGRQREAFAGCYGTTVRPGRIDVGAPVTVAG